VAALLRALLRNALDYLPRKADDDCLMELRWMYDRHNIEDARRDLAGLAAEMGFAISAAVRLGGSHHRADAQVLPAARPVLRIGLASYPMVTCVSRVG
jgi:hypothetical protein